MKDCNMKLDRTTIQAISFDLDDTLYDNRPVMIALEQGMEKWITQHYPKTASLNTTRWEQIKQQVAREKMELRDDVTQWRHARIQQGLSDCGYTLEEAQQGAEKAIEHMFSLRNQIDVPAKTHEVLQQLMEQVPIIAITNGNADPRQIGLDQYFDHVYYAGKDGKAKPNSALFQNAAQDLQLDPTQILHVGDDLICDVQGAKNAGLQTAWFNPSGSHQLLSAALLEAVDWEIQCLSDLTTLYS